jgi:hypothetical protein
MLEKKQTIGQEMADGLLTAVRYRWYNASPRVNGWKNSIANAYQAIYEEQPSRLIDLPKGATTKDDGTKDTAENILVAFNDWLGHNVVWDVYNIVIDER